MSLKTKCYFEVQYAIIYQPNEWVCKVYKVQIIQCYYSKFSDYFIQFAELVTQYLIQATFISNSILNQLKFWEENKHNQFTLKRIKQQKILPTKKLIETIETALKLRILADLMF